MVKNKDKKRLYITLIVIILLIVNFNDIITNDLKNKLV